MTAIETTSTAYKFARTKLGDYRAVKESIEDALAILRSIILAESFPSDFPVVVAGVGAIDLTDSDTIPPITEWSPEAQAAFTTPGVLVAISFIGVRGMDGPNGKKVNGAKGFAVYPVHPLDSIMADEAGAAWLWKVAEKEASHVAFRGLRGIESALGIDALAAAAKAMPLSVADYVEESYTESQDSGAFDKLWNDFRKALGAHPGTAPLVPALPGKADVIKCIRSKAYALDVRPELESANIFTFIGSKMADIIDTERAAAIERGEDFEFDSKQIRDWLATRNEKVFPAKAAVEVDVSKLDFASFMAG